ncbi:MAG: DUF2975 domain-containing protein [Ruminiclostridium sp.]|nr:DUF2975 domain-containing protein [Ruminiclostridium sp.]
MNIKWTSANSLKLTRILTTAVFLLACGVLFLIPIITQWYDDVSGKPPIMPVLTVCFYICDGLAILALWELNTMLKNISKQELFTDRNTRCVRIISWCCFGVAAVFAGLAFWRLLALLVAIIVGFVGLILRVVKNMLASAAEMREENDYTI